MSQDTSQGQGSSQGLNIFWFLPTHGDGHYIGSSAGARPVDFGYLRHVAQAADELGFHGVLIPTGNTCEDAWVVGSSLIGETRRLKFLVAVRPGISSPTLAARMAATFDRLSNGRLLVNVVAGGDAAQLAGDGLFLDHDERYALTDEYLTVWRQALAGETVSLEGDHLKVQGARLYFPPVQAPHPPLYFGGSSEPARELTAKHGEVYLTWGEPPAQVAEKIADVRQRAERHGRTVRFGIRLHIIVRETETEAWEAADRLIGHLDDATVATTQARLAATDSEGQHRMLQLHAKGGGRSREALEVYPNLWAGVGLVRGGAGTALVGDPRSVAQLVKEYAALGIDTFILSGYPHLEEAYRTAELLFPELPLARSNGHEGVGDPIPANRFRWLGDVGTVAPSVAASPTNGTHAPARGKHRSTNGARRSTNGHGH